MEKIRKKLEAICGMVQENVSFTSLTNFKTGGPARYLVSPEDLQEIEAVLSFSAENSIPLLIIGNGTNILVSDDGFQGIVVTTRRLNRILVDDENELVVCEPGVRLSTLLKTCITHRFTGAEFLAGIPGTVGGGIISNAGLKILWLSKIIKEIEVVRMTGGIPYLLSRQEINFGYRTSNLEDIFICRAEVQIKKESTERIKELIAGYMKKRIASQPLEYPSAGSIFKNPPGFFAGELIDRCGMKGVSRGGACVSEKHANFIINKGNATSSDIYGLIEDIRNKVEKVYNLKLEPEIKIIGRF